jgi:hypothetical protein
MAADAGYPSNTFKTGILNSLYGGATGREWGGPAWDFISGWVRDIADWLITNVMVPWRVSVVTTQDALMPGDIVVMDLTRSATVNGLPYPYFRKFNGGSGYVALGLAAAAAGSGGLATVAYSGPVPVSMTGLTGLTAGSRVSGDATTGRLKAWAVGDEALGYVDPAGNVFVLGAGRAP